MRNIRSVILRDRQGVALCKYQLPRIKQLIDRAALYLLNLSYSGRLKKSTLHQDEASSYFLKTAIAPGGSEQNQTGYLHHCFFVAKDQHLQLFFHSKHSAIYFQYHLY